MKKQFTKTCLAFAAVAVVALFGGCKPQEERGEAAGHEQEKAGAEDHSGHAHAKVAAPVKDEHAGHNHGPGEHGAAKPHVVVKDGVEMCTEHGVPEATCAICKPDLAGKLKPGESLQVRLPSTNSTTLVGVRTATPETGAIADGIECVAEVSFNQNKLAQIAAPVSGIVQAVDVDLGSAVEEQQTVAKIWSASIAEAVAKAVLAHQTMERERKLRAGRVTSEASLQEAEATHRAACQQLRTLGFTEQQIDEMGCKPEEQVLMEVRAPFAGEIVERMAVRGSLVEVGKPLFTVVDHSTVWAMLQVPESALERVRVGQAVELRVDSLPGRLFAGKLTWISPAVDERTRMARARAEFANPDRLLKDKMFATARILTRQETAALLVPLAAVQHMEGKPFVFVWQAADLFDARAVQLGAKHNGRLEVLAGLKPQEAVAISHAFALKSAMLMSRLGAGCADD
jgi:cobalt-zinc-cadmium efflux system membrane fusion protein